MQLQEWFHKKTKRPLQIVFVIIILGWSSFVLMGIQSQKKSIEEKLINLDKQVSLAITQNNRPLIEFILENAYHQFGADSISLCIDGEMEIEINTTGNICKVSGGFSLFSKNISGTKSTRLVIKKNLLYSIFGYVLVLTLALLFLWSVLKILNNLKRDLLADVIAPLEHLFDDEFETKIAEIYSIKSKLKEAIAIDKKMAQANANIIISKQVAHDIRSPLSALSLVATTLNNVSEDKRLLIRNAIQRINDIANDLLSKGKESVDSERLERTKSDEVGKKNPSEIILLPALVDSLVSEKRIQFRSLMNVSIDLELQNSFGAFVFASSTEIARVLSNLINNSIEAFKNEVGNVKIMICGYAETVRLIVQDNGAGIPAEILEKLGVLGVTSGKEGSQSGSGLGIYHAKKAIENAGGKFIIDSTVGIGTTMTIDLPRCAIPSWFLQEIRISVGSEVISLDDDLTIHQIWKGRLESLRADEKGITFRSFTSAMEFKKYLLHNNPGDLPKKNRFYLLDFELLGQGVNGLELIEELGLVENTVLVTSRYEEPEVKRRCEKQKIKLLPKTLAGFVPIKVEAKKEKFDWILIDDDQLVHLTWQMAASDSSCKFIGFKSIDEFNNRKSQFDQKSQIFIDSALGEGIKGEDIARKLFQEGFSNIYLATGYSKENFPEMTFIKGVIGKEPPLWSAEK